MKIRRTINEDFEKIKNKASKGKPRRVSLNFEEGDIQKLKIEAAKQKTTMSEILRKLIKDYIK